MYIKEVSLQGFRNLEPLHIAPTAGMNLFYGDNAQGKTNFLESLYFCALGRSLRGRSEQQLIAFGEEESHIRLEVMRKNRGDRIDVHLKRDEKKGIAVNGIPVKKWGNCSAPFTLSYSRPRIYLSSKTARRNAGGFWIWS